MTEHLTRHDAEDEQDLTGREDVHETGGYRDDSDADVPGQDRADFREPDTAGDDQNLSTADLASAGRHDTDDTTASYGSGGDVEAPAGSGGDVETPAGSGGDVETPAASGGDVETPAGSGGDVERPAASDGDVETPELIDEEKVTGFRERWQNVQTGFVDDPKQAVRQADELVAAVISALATTFAEHKSELESQWQQGEPATEELRIALRRYRSFFDQLLPR
ncbi:hypothetical protein AMES_2976 [Amycolatopsis mediterranei S699]|uniref:Uncharacterized protein n=2 Tax=Amycolatopsis mediterranei TaxID=33910 RepID=A0A0H3D3L0_AMYMU|nr:hypothetical protein [Amycolatopsis mediterranei]ADJ44801.1 conserved hypothetical protein [Amycolatopsis mediterranei U32]AEK41547.1 hypothetical protein RAM_15295 [Amycolatopsis mediterranei S699]AFO76512.1 hypothetical protein AMES_2976 [Amycolatopsis mediterranei S699]AGT83641.1 hypothetical protein B737_2977 [Amycolatopsis mediterranei RB]KDO07374.1 hypothetical protein DV26_29245 [Amycolatopsis mediterranei]